MRATSAILFPKSISRIAAIFNSREYSCRGTSIVSPPFNVIGPLISCLIFGVHSSLEAFEAQLNQQLERLQRELKEDTYQPLPVRQHPIPKRDKPGEYRMLGIPAIYDRVCQQALLNRLEPIFEPLFD